MYEYSYAYPKLQFQNYPFQYHLSQFLVYYSYSTFKFYVGHFLYHKWLLRIINVQNDDFGNFCKRKSTFWPLKHLKWAVG